VKKLSEYDEPKTKKKHLGTVTCPACNALIDIFEIEVIDQPSQKKISTKSLEASKTIQKPLA